MISLIVTVVKVNNKLDHVLNVSLNVITNNILKQHERN